MAKGDQRRSHRSQQQSQSKEVVIVLGGSFAPLHAGHLSALEAGRKKAARSGFVVVAGYLAVAHDSHLRAKLRSRGDSQGELDLSAYERLRVCNEVAEASTWLRPTPCLHGSAKQCGKVMVAANHRPSTGVVVVRGADLPTLASSGQGQTLSSTYVRDAIRAGGITAVRRLARDGVLPPAVASHLELQLAGASTAAEEREQPTGTAAPPPTAAADGARIGDAHVCPAGKI